MVSLRLGRVVGVGVHGGNRRLVPPVHRVRVVVQVRRVRVDRVAVLRKGLRAMLFRPR